MSLQRNSGSSGSIKKRSSDSWNRRQPIPQIRHSREGVDEDDLYESSSSGAGGRGHSQSASPPSSLYSLSRRRSSQSLSHQKQNSNRRRSVSLGPVAGHQEDISELDGKKNE